MQFLKITVDRTQKSANLFLEHQERKNPMNDENLFEDVEVEEAFDPASLDMGGMLDNLHEQNAFEISPELFEAMNHDDMEEFE